MALTNSGTGRRSSAGLELVDAGVTRAYLLAELVHLLGLKTIETALALERHYWKRSSVVVEDNEHRDARREAEIVG